MVTISVGAFVAALGIPSAITGFCFWLIQRKIKAKDEAEKTERAKREAEVDKREKAREQNELYVIQQLSALSALSFATARAVQRIPDAHCNGDMDAALDYAEKIKHAQRDFLTEQAVQVLY